MVSGWGEGLGRCSRRSSSLTLLRQASWRGWRERTGRNTSRRCRWRGRWRRRGRPRSSMTPRSRRRIAWTHCAVPSGPSALIYLYMHASPEKKAVQSPVCAFWSPLSPGEEGMHTRAVFDAPFRAALTARVARRLDRASIFTSQRATSALETAQCSIAADGRRIQTEGDGRRAEWCRYRGSSIQS